MCKASSCQRQIIYYLQMFTKILLGNKFYFLCHIQSLFKNLYLIYILKYLFNLHSIHIKFNLFNLRINTLQNLNRKNKQLETLKYNFYLRVRSSKYTYTLVATHTPLKKVLYFTATRKNSQHPINVIFT